MSSHHIVREKQEPALLIISLDDFDPEHLGQLLEWSPTVFVADPAYAQAESLGIKVDGVLSSNTEFPSQANCKLLPSQNHLEDGLKYFISEQYPAVNVIANTFHIKDYTLYIDFINVVIYVDNLKIYPIRSGFSKWKAAGEKITLLHEVHNLQCSNLQHHTPTELHVQHAGFFSLCFDQPFIFIAEEF